MPQTLNPRARQIPFRVAPKEQHHEFTLRHEPWRGCAVSAFKLDGERIPASAVRRLQPNISPQGKAREIDLDYYGVVIAQPRKSTCPHCDQLLVSGIVPYPAGTCADVNQRQRVSDLYHTHLSLNPECLRSALKSNK